MRKACLVVIDGWGISPNNTQSIHPNLIKYDAITNANTPNMNRFMKEYPFMPLSAHGTSVGLPDGLMGNSEVGHLNIGAGRIVYQDIVRIDKTVHDNVLDQQKALKNAYIDIAKNPNSKVHIIGLVSDGGVHSHINHLFDLIKLSRKHLPDHATYIHFIGDGRDTSPKSASGYFKQLHSFIQDQDLHSTIKIATIIGRYYAMDRDKRWERTKIAYDAYVNGQGEFIPFSSSNSESRLETIIDKLNEKYNQEETDEFFKPLILEQDATIKPDDYVIFFNYRSDRMRQIVSCFISCLNFSPPFETRIHPHVITMTQYNHEFSSLVDVIFPPQSMDNVLSEWLSKKNLTQCHIAETEKYAHVTFFFNGGREICFEGEDRILVPSPNVLTYDLAPEMSAFQVADQVIQKISMDKYSLVMCNLAPPDMVGHTGKYQETIRAVEVTDDVIGRISNACDEYGYTLFITADHGNAEKMVDEEGRPHTAHTISPVPFIMVHKGRDSFEYRPDAALCDVAPTILDFMELDIPDDMNGHSLLANK